MCFLSIIFHSLFIILFINLWFIIYLSYIFYLWFLFIIYHFIYLFIIYYLFISSFFIYSLSFYLFIYYQLSIYLIYFFIWVGVGLSAMFTFLNYICKHRLDPQQLFMIIILAFGPTSTLLSTISCIYIIHFGLILSRVDRLVRRFCICIISAHFRERLSVPGKLDLSGSHFLNEFLCHFSRSLS